MASPLIVFGIPSYGTVDAEWVQALRGMHMPLGAATNDVWVLGTELSIADKRNLIVKQALAVGAKYVMFIGDDNILPPHTIGRFLQMAAFEPEDRKVITGLYMSRQFPPQTMIWKDYMQGSFYDFHVGDFFEVDWAGCDVLFVDTDVFRKVEEPWFSLNYVFEQGQQKPSSLATEDIYFYEKVRAAGFKVWCDTSIMAGHKDRVSGVNFTMPTDWPQWDRSKAIPNYDPSYLVADIGSGSVERYPMEQQGTVIKMDLNPAYSPDILCDVRAIPEPDQKYDKVYSSHTLEHFLMKEAPAALREWVRILKIGGELEIIVPNFGDAIQKIVDGTADEYNWWQVYGRQGNKLDVHFNGFTQKNLSSLAEMAWGEADIIKGNGADIADGIGCLEGITVEVTGKNGENLTLKALKVRHPTPTVLGPRGDLNPDPTKTAETPIVAAKALVDGFLGLIRWNSKKEKSK